MAKVVLENVYKTFHPVQQGLLARGSNPSEPTTPHGVLRRIDLTVEDGEFLVLVGPSGCGKSTLLRVIAGLEELTAGNVWIGETLVNELPPKVRDIAMVFQSYALYPHLKVYDNLAFGLRRIQGEGFLGLRARAQREKGIAEQVRRVAKLLQIELLLHRYPKQLSGGQKQRVALGRAIARNPQVFLMDEPLSNLDAKLRMETRVQIVELQRSLGITTIYVTHDQTEAMTMGSRIAVMNQGQIQQLASPLEIYQAPANRFVAEFMGSPSMNFLAVRYSEPLRLTHSSFQITLPPGWAKSLQSYLQPSSQPDLTLGIRPEHLVLRALGLQAEVNTLSNLIPLRVHRLEVLGYETLLYGRFAPSDRVTTGSEPLSEDLALVLVRVPGEVAARPGEMVWVEILLEKVHLFDARTELAIART